MNTIKCHRKGVTNLSQAASIHLSFPLGALWSLQAQPSPALVSGDPQLSDSRQVLPAQLSPAAPQPLPALLSPCLTFWMWNLSLCTWALSRARSATAMTSPMSRNLWRGTVSTRGGTSGTGAQGAAAVRGTADCVLPPSTSLPTHSTRESSPMALEGPLLRAPRAWAEGTLPWWSRCCCFSCSTFCSMSCSLAWCSDSILCASAIFWAKSCKAERLRRLGTGILAALGQGSSMCPLIPFQDRTRIHEGCETPAVLPACARL